MDSGVVKIPALLWASIAFHKTAVPASGPGREKGTTRSRKQERLARLFPFREAATVATLIYALNNTLEAVALTAAQFPSATLAEAVLSCLCNTEDAPGLHSVGLHPFWVVGFLLIIAGSIFRYTAARAAGKFFTYDLIIHEDHRLVTSGPYAYLRHPAYLGVLLASVGMCMCSLGPGSWLQECGWLTTRLGKALRAAMIGWAAVVAIVLLDRVPAEDELLKKELGNEWAEWAKRVKWAMIPGVL